MGKAVGKGNGNDALRRMISNLAIELKIPEITAAEALIRQIHEIKKTLPPRPSVFGRKT